MNTPNPLNSYSQPLYPPPLLVNRTAGPAKVFGIIYAVLAVLSVFGFLALLGLAFVPGIMNQYGGDETVPTLAPKVLFGTLAIIVALSMALHAATAYGLLALKPWGRTLAIVTSIITLLSIPVGTIIGAIALYFFLRQGAQQDYDRLAAQRQGYLPSYPTSQF